MANRTTVTRMVLGIMAALLSSCTAALQPMGPALQVPVLGADRIVAADGAVLPMNTWLPPGPPRAVIVALHGINDYAQAFDMPGRWLAERGIAVYAYDQRGFGRTGRIGIWPGVPTLVSDLLTATQLTRKAYPDLPVYWLGESMGGAIVITAAANSANSGNENHSPAGIGCHPDGLILVAPAIWDRQSMPLLQQWALSLAVRLVPGLMVSPPSTIRIEPSDNIEMLRRLARDPLFLKENRIDVIDGLVTLMSRAREGLPKLTCAPTIMLYGQKEQVLPEDPVRAAIAALPSGNSRVIVYPTGYHMLLRDLGAERVYSDILEFVTSQIGLPSP